MSNQFSPHRAIQTAIIFVIFYIAVRALSNYTVFNIFAYDFFYLLSGFNRVSQGLLPYRDFQTPVGPLFYEIIKTTIYLFGSGAEAITHTTTVPTIIVSIFLIRMLLRRTDPATACLIVIYFISIGLSPRPLGYANEFVAFSAPYNILSILLLGIVFASLPSLRHNHQTVSRIEETLLVGVALAGLIAIKASHGIIASLLVLCFSVTTEKHLSFFRRNHVKSIAVGAFILGISIVASYSTWSGYFSDIMMTAKASEIHGRVIWKLFDLAFFHSVTLCLMLACLYAIVAARRLSEKSSCEGIYSYIIATCAGLAIVYNDHASELFFFPLVALLANNYIFLLNVNHFSTKIPRFSIRVYCVFFIVASIFLTISYAHKSKTLPEFDWGPAHM